MELIWTLNGCKEISTFTFITSLTHTERQEHLVSKNFPMDFSWIITAMWPLIRHTRQLIGDRDPYQVKCCITHGWILIFCCKFSIEWETICTRRLCQWVWILNMCLLMFTASAMRWQEPKCNYLSLGTKSAWLIWVSSSRNQNMLFLRKYLAFLMKLLRKMIFLLTSWSTKNFKDLSFPNWKNFSWWSHRI